MSDDNVKPIDAERNKELKEKLQQLTMEEREALLEKSKRADEQMKKIREYHMETQAFISAKEQFLTTIINGWVSHHGNYELDNLVAGDDGVFEDHLHIAGRMAARYIREHNEYIRRREEHAPVLEGDK